MITLILLLSFTAPLQDARQIRSIDFRNFTFDSGSSTDKIVLQNSVYLKGSAPLKDQSRITKLKYVDINGDGKEEAAIVIHTAVSGSMLWCEDYYIFAYRNGRAEPIFHEWRERGEGMYIRKRSIEIIAPAWVKDPHCCPSYIEKVRYRWRGGRFIVVARQRRANSQPSRKAA